MCQELYVALFPGGMLGCTQEELKSMESQPSPESRSLKTIALSFAKYCYTSCQLYCNDLTSVVIQSVPVCNIPVYLVTIIIVSHSMVIAVLQLNW